MDRVTVRWNGERQFVGWDQAGHGVVMDAAREHKGEGTGVRPIEMLLYGLAGCTGMDVVSILEKKRQDVRGLTVEVTGHQRVDEYPKIYTEVEVEYVVTGFGVSAEAVRRAIELSEEKYCAVGGMIAGTVRISTSFRVEEADPPPREGA